MLCFLCCFRTLRYHALHPVGRTYPRLRTARSSRSHNSTYQSGYLLLAAVLLIYLFNQRHDTGYTFEWMDSVLFVFNLYWGRKFPGSQEEDLGNVLYLNGTFQAFHSLLGLDI